MDLQFCRFPDLPPIEPPAELCLPNPGVWRVAARWLHDHQPDEGGQVAVEKILEYSRRTAARRVRQARAAGLLPPTTPGKRKA